MLNYFTSFNGTINGESLRDFLAKLDYTVEGSDNRVSHVTNILEDSTFFRTYFGGDYFKVNATEKTPLSENNAVCKTLDVMSDYIIFELDKEEKAARASYLKEKSDVITQGRQDTFKRRELSMEGLLGKLDKCEDAFYNMTRNDKNIILKPKTSITQKDLEEIPELASLREQITLLDLKVKAGHFSGKDLYKVKKMIIEMRQQQYIIKNAYRKPIVFLKSQKPSPVIQFESDTKYTNEQGQEVLVSKNKIEMEDPKHISALLCNYSLLWEASWEDTQSDMKYMLWMLNQMVDAALKEDHPYYYDILIWKIDGLKNKEIIDNLQLKWGIKHSQEYISSLWRNKIPKLIAERYDADFEDYYYTYIEKGTYKKCNRCGEIKLANTRYFSKNPSSKDGLYSICKECRRKSGKKKK